LTVYNTQKVESFEACIRMFLEDVPLEHRPTIGVVGIAGPVNKNTVKPVNIPHWPLSDGH